MATSTQLFCIGRVYWQDELWGKLTSRSAMAEYNCVISVLLRNVVHHCMICTRYRQEAGRRSIGHAFTDSARVPAYWSGLCRTNHFEAKSEHDHERIHRSFRVYVI